jgi:erythronate-4-phosphate dehydrogenase
MSARPNRARTVRRPATDSPRLNILVDQNIRGAQSTFGRHALLTFMNGRAIRNEHLAGTDALIIRTATVVDETLLRGTPVRFVGSTSIGIDHVDTNWLDSRGITWANAPGCNADGTAQYTLAIAWLACQRLGRHLPDLSAAVIGRGNVGFRVQALLQALGLDVVANDPPLADAGVSGLVSLDDALARDLVFLHVPLTRTGAYPTHRFIGRGQLARMHDDALLVNTSRGDVVDGDALLAELRANRIQAALDVWPNEPRIDPALLTASTVATPHVAGYSDDGKRNGTRMVYEAFCAWSGQEPQSMVPASPPGELRIAAGDDPLQRALEATCFVPRHDRAMRDLARCDAGQLVAGFDALRRDYPVRRDFQEWRVVCDDPVIGGTLQRLGFQVRAA